MIVTAHVKEHGGWRVNVSEEGVVWLTSTMWREKGLLGGPAGANPIMNAGSIYYFPSRDDAIDAAYAYIDAIELDPCKVCGSREIMEFSITDGVGGCRCTACGNSVTKTSLYGGAEDNPRRYWNDQQRSS